MNDRTAMLEARREFYKLLEKKEQLMSSITYVESSGQVASQGLWTEYYLIKNEMHRLDGLITAMKLGQIKNLNTDVSSYEPAGPRESDSGQEPTIDDQAVLRPERKADSRAADVRPRGDSSMVNCR